MLSGFLAGAVSATVSSPAELIMLWQQNKGTNILTTTREIMAQSPLRIYRGFIPTAARDGGLSVGYLALAETIRVGFVAPLFPQDSNLPPAILSGIIAGVFAAIVTHPFDTLKTDLQADITKQRFNGLFTALAWRMKSTSSGGSGRWTSLYKGFEPRAVRVISGVTIMSIIKDLLTRYVF
jgi:hypothetical protein